MINLTHCCIITDEVNELTNFYEKILKIEAERYGENYSEIEAGNTQLAIFGVFEQEDLAPGTARVRSNESLILEFKVEDLEAEYQRIKGMGIEMAKDITTQPWGNTSFYFRDSDGNLINFYTQS
ncbi:MAG TPA: VOC family protein [Halanaerobiales bacterium]|nr:VOC family protein [Halanaerobiales bacterium]